jgi:hypothetical protein
VIRALHLLSALVLGASALRADIIYTALAEPLWLNDEPPPVIGLPDRQYIDMDGDGTIDFSFSGTWNISVSFRSEGANGYLIVPDPPPNIGGAVAALDLGFLIGAESGDGSLDWFNHAAWAPLMLDLDPGREGEFWDTRAYIGIEFQVDDGIHYGWFDVEGSSSSLPYAMIHGWAYESVPGVGIVAGAIPEPSSMTLFAGGVLAMIFARAKERIR